MFAITKLIFDICLLQKGPQDIPTSAWILRFIFPCYLLINALILNLNVDFLSSLLHLAIDLCGLFLFALLLLHLYNKRSRFYQTFSALLGTDALLTLLVMPALATFSVNPSLPAFIVIVLSILWHWVVLGHIFRHALDQSLSFSLGLVLLYLVLLYWVNTHLFPELSQSNSA